ncbi:MAG TPA: amidohydrolase family protein [Paludibaculum sp.]
MLLLLLSALVITDARVFDGERILPRANVVVEDGIITDVGTTVKPKPGARIISGAGRTLLPGLIDAHFHVLNPDALNAALAHGATTLIDMFNRPDVQFGPGADVYSARVLVTAPGGHGTEYGVAIPTIRTQDEAQSFVDARIAEGSRFIKIILDDGSAFNFQRPALNKATLNAVVAAAHRRHKLAVVHIATKQDVLDALEAGADGLQHIYAGEPDAALARRIARSKVFVTPTLSVVKAHAPQALAVVRQLHNAGVSLHAGTDVPNENLAPGASLHDELALLVQAGLTLAEALAAATSRPAAAFGLIDRGRLGKGLRADLLLVEGDPTVNIQATRAIVGVWQRGVEFTKITLD